MPERNSRSRSRGNGTPGGVFITFEGCEGSGKTTQAVMLRDHLAAGGREVVLTREPGGTEVGKALRGILLNPAGGDIHPVTEALLFAADRAQQVKDVIEPALQNGCIVIGDRYVDSSLAYQGVGRGCGLEQVRDINEWATGGLEPDLTIYLDIPVREGLARVKPHSLDRIEQETMDFHERVQSAYETLMDIYKHRYVVIEATGTPEDVSSRVVEKVESFLERSGG